MGPNLGLITPSLASSASLTYSPNQGPAHCPTVAQPRPTLLPTCRTVQQGSLPALPSMQTATASTTGKAATTSALCASPKLLPPSSASDRQRPPFQQSLPLILHQRHHLSEPIILYAALCFCNPAKAARP